jgi:hypothetical protein
MYTKDIELTTFYFISNKLQSFLMRPPSERFVYKTHMEVHISKLKNITWKVHPMIFLCRQRGEVKV